MTDISVSVERPRRQCVRQGTYYPWSSPHPLTSFDSEIRLELTYKYFITHLHKLFLFQCDATRSLNRSERRSKLFIDQGRATQCRLLRYIGQYKFNAVLTKVDGYSTHHTTNKTGKEYCWCLKKCLIGVDSRPLIFPICWLKT